MLSAPRMWALAQQHHSLRSVRRGDQAELAQRAGAAEQVDRGDLPAGEREAENHPRPAADRPAAAVVLAGLVILLFQLVLPSWPDML
jgi:hypothetical protein